MSEYLDTMLDILRANHRTMKTMVQTIEAQTRMLERLLELAEAEAEREGGSPQ